VVIHIVLGIKHAFGLGNSDVQGYPFTTAGTMDSIGGIDAMVFKPRFNSINGMRVGSNEGVDFFLGQVFTVPATC
jgi:hypothetical protein